MTHGTALIVGAGKGLSASLARRLATEGFRVALVARDVNKLAALAAETGARTYQGDARDPAAIADIFNRVDRELGPLELVVFNAGERYRGPIDELVPEKVLDAYRTTAFAGFLTAQAAAKRMLAQGRGSIFFTGATASVKALAQSVPFSMPKFALRASWRPKTSTWCISCSMAVWPAVGPSRASPAWPTDGWTPMRWPRPISMRIASIARRGHGK
jgi:NAD(P)-dependent dehydrogenase (short-subunit alcohol dehydrogenase family)